MLRAASQRLDSGAHETTSRVMMALTFMTHLQEHHHHDTRRASAS
jgi:hypothetical protein